MTKSGPFASRTRIVIFALMVLSSVGIAIAMMAFYALFPIGEMTGPSLRESFLKHPVPVYIHVFCSGLALLLGPLQFFPTLRMKHPRAHRLLGRLYLGLLVPVGGIASMYLSAYAQGGVTARVGFFALASCWLLTDVIAFYTAYQRDFAAHRRWATRNYSLTFAAVTLRAYLGITLGISGDGSFDSAYRIIAWLCWVPNVVITELFILRRKPWAWIP